eukprot:Blabericola_migrator_1__3757@NODE_2126_length_3233_cov_52_023057_g1348_i0_p2_GENE_NODE_2126_length_3233_cov_52_023057_g1348_i0NODE_2126_length_3233_cov_52_023057_g1348_i0_p2_ORF_typecomplete_len447_score73_38Ras/PF00071_22/0_36_NODE_2126_length_3233_cov_52_023057_g1348_i03441684
MDEAVLISKHKAQYPDVQDLLFDPEKAEAFVRSTLETTGDVLRLVETCGSKKRLLGGRKPCVCFAKEERVQQSELEVGNGVYVRPKPLVRDVEPITSVCLPMTKAFEAIYLQSHPILEIKDTEAKDETKEENDTTEAYYRVLSFNPSQRVATLASCETLKSQPSDPYSEIAIGNDAPKLYYEGQLLRVHQTSIDTGRPAKKATLLDVPDVPFKADAIFICFAIPNNATAANVEDLLLALDQHCEEQALCNIICFINCNPNLCNWAQLEAEWNNRHQQEKVLHMLGVHHSDPWNYTGLFERDLVLRFEYNGVRMPFVFTNLPLVQCLNPRPLPEFSSHNMLDGLVRDLMKNRHLLPPLWLSSNPPSLHPFEAPTLEVDPTQDFILVCPNEAKHSTHFGKSGLHCGIFTPPLSLCTITYRGGPSTRPMQPWRRLIVTMANIQPVSKVA